MIIIYDFDGTLTPFGLPQYEILKRLGYDDTKVLERVRGLMKKELLSLYQAFYKTYEDILRENDLEMNFDNITLGANDVVFNPGVLSYFEEMQEKNSGIEHFIVTSGFDEYVRNTKIRSFVNGIYGVTFHKEGDIYTTIKRLVSDEDKPQIIKEILKDKDDQKIIYIGDGLTDKYAFEYVHSLGGTSIYVGTTEKDFADYEILKEEGIVDEFFQRDYEEKSELKQFIKKEMLSESKSI